MQFLFLRKLPLFAVLRECRDRLFVASWRKIYIVDIDVFQTYTATGIDRVGVCGIPVPKEATSVDSIAKNAGGSGPLKSPLPTKLLLRWEDIQADHLDVPAEICKDLKLCECAQFEERKRCKEDNQLRLGMCV